MAADQTPMMRQYFAIRKDLPSDVLLFFRLGDFYELFFDDAVAAAPILNVALTKRQDIPMCGVPHHAAQQYIARLIKAGKRVAMAEQRGEVKPGKLVERELSRIITAGTFDEDGFVDSGAGHYVAAAHRMKQRWGLSWIDLTTGEFRVGEYDAGAALADEARRLDPKELLVAEDQAAEFRALAEELPFREIDDYSFLSAQANHVLLSHFQTQSLDGFGVGDLTAGLGAAGAALGYVKDILRRDAGHVRRLRQAEAGDSLIMDAGTLSHLEVLRCRNEGGVSLLKALDRTRTPMGARLLRDWLSRPLRAKVPLEARFEAVERLRGDPMLLHHLRDALGTVRDVQRLAARLSQGSGNARDLLTLADSLHQSARLALDLRGPGVEAPLLAGIGGGLHDFTEFTDRVQDSIVPDPPVSWKDGGVFQDGVLPALDELREASRNGKQWIADLQTKEIDRTGVKSLKVRHNSVFGYYIEITKANTGAVPDDYERKQTTANAERYVTAELRDMEAKILGADDRARALEMEEFQKLRDSVADQIDLIQDTAAALGRLDVLCAFAENARLFSHTRPVISAPGVLTVRDGRHPVLDQSLTGDKFVPNDTFLEPKEHRLMILTGPNMAGKSTYIRQVALLTLMAQAGSFVPASFMEIGLADRIFARVGASDDLARGQSTFMVEMNETALILNNATADSLIILDEIGRGTSTFDGLSIAWSVAEHIHDVIGARALFATHYHELTRLVRRCEAAKNYNVAVREWNERIIFLRKIVSGPADKSYGIQVARLAGLPDTVLDRAREILNVLEGEQAALGKLRSATRKKSSNEEDDAQLPLF